MNILRQDLRFAWRSLRMHPGFAWVTIVTLALGIGASTAMFSVVRGVLLKALPYPDSDRIVTVWESLPEAPGAGQGGLISHPNFLDVQGRPGLFESIAQVSGTNLTVTHDGVGAEIVRGALVTPGFFDVFRAGPEVGRDFTADEDVPNGPAVAILGDAYWRDRLGGREDVLGSQVRIGGQAYEVVGVAPAGFDHPDGAQIWLPGQNDDARCGRGCVTRGSVGRLAGGATVDGVRTELVMLAERLRAEYPGTNDDVTFEIATLRDVTVGDVRPALWMLLAMVGLVLLIACANVANILILRGQRRSTEIAIRAALGAGRRRIVRQLMTETAVLAVIGGLAGIALAVWGVHVVLSLAPAGIPRLDEITVDLTTLGFSTLLAGTAVLLCGLAPALSLSDREIHQSLRQGGRGSVGKGQRGIGGSAALVSEVALSVVLLIGAGLMFRSLVHMAEVDPGFEPAGVTTFRVILPAARYPDPGANVAFMEQLQERLAALPGVEDAALMTAPPLSNVSLFGTFSRADAAPAPGGEDPSAAYRVASPGALEMLRIPMIAGRAFDSRDRRGAPPVVLISESTRDRYFPGEDPVGQRIDVHISVGYPETEPRTIVGVFGDIRGSVITTEAVPELMVPYAQSGSSFPNVLLAGSDPDALLDAARAVVGDLDTELPFVQAGSMEDWVSEQLAATRFYLTLLGGFAFLAVLLAAVGMYGVVAYFVAWRRREIGVRMALGARAWRVVLMVLWQGLRPALVGVALGLVGSFWAMNLMDRLLYGVAAQDPFVFGLVPGMLLLVIVAACVAPARAAARISPVTALQADA